MTGTDTNTGTESGNDPPSDVDVERLKRDIEGIKEVMGIEERYPSLVRLWLVFAVLVLFASLASQYIMSNRLPSYWFSVVWLGSMAIGIGIRWRLGGHTSYNTSRDRPNLFYQFGFVFLAGILVELITNPLLENLGYVDGALYAFSIWISLTGVGYLIVANTLRAYRIRHKDRAAFAVGGVLLMGYVVLVTYWEPLRPWTYAVFGVSYFIYGVVSYGILRGA